MGARTACSGRFFLLAGNFQGCSRASGSFRNRTGFARTLHQPQITRSLHKHHYRGKLCPEIPVASTLLMDRGESALDAHSSGTVAVKPPNGSHGRALNIAITDIACHETQADHRHGHLQTRCAVETCV
ncbi:hypothetical protein SKAU_G00247580 [Synaphobranchus kaupii]|uniref:Uncharacterized protein n=1 Tax=Synaphobranchus kaupii TaxID=118154 RepID=A0A9Q1IRC0_SYNKA|nr:hypothetical protein SKAU_G00247580 [Synaphobranchus kaupii]